MVPGTTQWQYVKVCTGLYSQNCFSSLPHRQPIPGHAICNLGDSMTIFSGGILRSNLHRVV